MNGLNLRADCARCAALCCLALAFDKGSQFGHDKAAGQPCSYLRRHGCGIHSDRTDRGYIGCVRYDCLGAGQRVTQDLFQGADWRKDPSLLRPMAEAFSVVQRAHAMLALLDRARRLPLAQADQDRVAGFETALVAARASPEAVAWHTAEAGQFLRSLRRYVDRPATG